MVRVNYFVKDNRIEKVILKGHSNFDVNACLKIDKESIKHSEGKEVVITIIKHSDIVDTLINNMIDLLTELSKQYENNIKIGGESCV